MSCESIPLETAKFFVVLCRVKLHMNMIFDISEDGSELATHLLRFKIIIDGRLLEIFGIIVFRRVV